MTQVAQAFESEQVILAAAITDPAALSTIRIQVKPDDFTGAHKLIFQTACDLTDLGAPLDIQTMAKELRRLERLESVGGSPYLSTLLDSVPAVANLNHHIAEVKRENRRRSALHLVERAASTGNQEHLTEALEQLQSSVDGNWGAPVSLEQASIYTEEAFPLHALPHTLRTFVEELSVQLQTAPAMAAGSALMALSVACQKAFTIHCTQTWREPLSTYWCICADPAERKSPVFSACVDPIKKWEAGETKRVKPARVRSLLKYKLLEQRAESSAKAAAKSGDEELTMEAEHAAMELATFVIVSEPKMFCQDITSEKMAMELAEHDGRMALISAEGGIFETMAGRYTSGVPNIDVYLQGHSGDMIRIDRKSGTSIHIDKPALTFGLMVQPGVVRDLAAKPGFADRGLLARFLYVIPKSKIGHRDPRSPSLTKGAADAYAMTVQSILNWTSNNRAPDGSLTTTELRLDSDAEELFIQYQERLEPGLMEGGRLQNVRAWAGKLAGAAARLAGLIAVAEWTERSPVFIKAVEAAPDIDLDGIFDEDVGREPLKWVTHQQMGAAIEIADYLLESAIVAFSSLMATGETAVPKRIVDWLIKHKPRTVTRRELLRALSGVKAAQIEPAVHLLEQHGYLRRVDSNVATSIKWSVNPNTWGGGKK